MKPLWIAIRPKTLIASISPVAIGTAVGAAQGVFSPWLLLCTLLCAMGIQITCNVANDLLDFLKGADTKDRKGPIRVTASGLMTIAQVKLLTFAMMGFTAICGAFLAHRGGLVIALLVALALVLALAYTSGPLPLAYLGLAEVFILIFFGPVASGFTYYLQTLKFSATPFWAGLAPGMISCGILVINNLRDVHEDREAKKKTLVVRFGSTFGKWEYAVAVCTAPLIPVFFALAYPFLVAPVICLIPAVSLSRSVILASHPQDYTPLFAKTGRLLTLYTALFCIGILL